MFLKRNLHVIDRLVRVVLAAIFIYLGFIEHSVINNSLIAILIGIFGLVNLFAGITSHCPVYALAGLSTYKDQDDQEKAE